MQLTVRSSPRDDVGPYTVTLPGYARPGLQPTADSYAPFLIEACRGDTLRLTLRNDWSTPINLHTHGFIVAPTPDVPGPPGDYIYMAINPGHQVDYRIEIPRNLPGEMFGRYPVPQPYPTGLYWFHNHMHGYSADTVTAGQSGIISVGDPSTLEHADANGAYVAQSLPPNTDVKYLALRDIQLNVPNCPSGASDCTPGSAMLPDKVTKPPYAHGVTWVSGDSYDTTMCSGTKVVQGAGYCAVPGPTASKVWLFTVSGQNFPQITLPADHNHLWRIANISASATYVLELKDNATGILQPMHVLKIDGVVSGTALSNDPHEMPGVHLQHLLLMPGARAEVFISGQDFAAAAQGKPQDLTFQTSGIETGIAGVGDPWPAVALAHVHVEPSPGHMAPLGLSNLRINAPEKIAATSNPPKGPVPAGCIILPAGNRRVITFAQNNTTNVFMLGSEVVSADGRPVPGTKIDPVAFPQMSMNMPMNWDALIAALPGGRHVCATLGSIEVWELLNTTDEMHNFHIHQTRFRLADGHDPGAPPDLVIGQTNDCQAKPEKAVCDPGAIVGQAMPEFDSAAPVGKVTIWHDSLPVPPRIFDPVHHQYINGHAYVVIPFVAPVQVGRFVFHCHILEHEDGGMMAPMEVIP